MIGRVLYAVSVAAAFVVSPVWAAAPAANPAVTHVTWQRDGVITWERIEHRAVAPPTLTRLTPGMALGRSKVVAHGRPGALEVSVRYSQRDGGSVHRKVLWSMLVRKAKPRILAEGIGDSPLTDFETRGATRMAFVAQGAMEMLATAYAADCAGCGGMTALGRRAGHGIVAVDPRVIPLGTRLYIPGYGLAIAGDTGGDIVGRRIDLGFDSLRGAVLFGRRDITVYRLK